MTPAAPHFVATGDIAAALVAQVKLVKLADGVTSAFDRVELFDVDSFIDAFRLQTISQKSVCLIIPHGEVWTTETQVRKILSRRTVPFTLFVSDRVLGDRVAALYGNATTLGAFGLLALTIPFVCGQLLPNPNGVVVSPVGAGSVALKSDKEKQNLPGRAAVALELDCQGGWIEAPLAGGPTL